MLRFLSSYRRSYLRDLFKRFYSKAMIRLPLSLEHIAQQTAISQQEIEQMAVSLGYTDTELTSEELSKLLYRFDLSTEIIINNVMTGKEIQLPLYSDSKKGNLDVDPEASSTWPARPPVVTILGHVDHGKTSLLDALRQSNIAAIYVPEFPGSSITFLDTPGHAAFTEMRKRGANVTDIAILVVSADDGIMEQTVESLNIIKESQIPYIVAITKIDLLSSNKAATILTIMKNLLQHGCHVEPLGGPVQIVSLSAKKKIGLEDLLASIVALGEQLDLRAPGADAPPTSLEAFVLESKYLHGLGPSATLLIRAGFLSLGSIIGTRDTLCKVRTISKNIKVALPSQAVEVSGWKSLPSVGAKVQYFGDNQETDSIGNTKSALNALRSYDSNILEKRILTHAVCFKLLLFCDVSGSIEPICKILQELGNNPKVSIQIIKTCIGFPTETDIDLAKIAQATLIVFNVHGNQRIIDYASSVKQKILSFSIIYELVDKVKELMEDMLPPVYLEKSIAMARVKKIFNVSYTKSKGGDSTIAGCIIEDGVMKPGGNTHIRIRRTGVGLIYSGKIKELRVHKDIVTLVPKGRECGIRLDPDFHDLQVGDIIDLVILTPEKDKIW